MRSTPGTPDFRLARLGAVAHGWGVTGKGEMAAWKRDGFQETWSAPAKTNLWLRVLGRRPDAFHEIESRMVRLSLADRIEAGSGPRGSGLVFRCDDPLLPVDERNLAVRAARLIEERCGLRFDLELVLHKEIPSGAGLGGGSSDAAAVLRGINRHLRTPLDPPALEEVARKLGADVPFFLHESTCDCTGTGTEVRPAPFPISLQLLLVKPPFGVPTPWAYSRWCDSRELPGAVYAGQSRPWGTLVNDLERPVFEKFLVLAHLKARLLADPGVSAALLSGSGATVFAVLDDESAEVARPRLERMIAEEFGPTFWVRAVTTLPDAHRSGKSP